MRLTTMRRLALPGLLILSLSGQAAQAALPPRFERQRELDAVRNVAAKLLQAPIDAITVTGDSTYLVKAGNCTLPVRIADVPNQHPPGWVGPRAFAAEPGKPVCR
jgi:hypothetical protein